MSADSFTPTFIGQVELGQPLPTFDLTHPTASTPYPQANLLVRIHNQPLGLLTIASPTAQLTPAVYAQPLFAQFNNEINAHLTDDGLPPVTDLPHTGLAPLTPALPCRAEDARVLASNPPLVSVLIPTHERPWGLPPCLDAVLDQTYPHYEVIVVDNAPRSDATRDLIETQYAGRVRYAREPRQGLSWARNCGAALAQGEILVWVDDDVTVDRDWLFGLVRGFYATENVACVNGLVLPAELESQAQHWFEQFGGFSKGFHRKIFDLDTHRPNRPLFPYAPGIVGTGASMAIRKTVYDTLGGADVALGAGTSTGGGEDLDLYFYILKRGHRIVYEPSSIAFHYHRREYDKLKRQMYNYGVGFSAHLTRCFLRQPLSLIPFLLQVPYGLYLVLSPKSFHNAQKRADYPAELTQLERQGMLAGPLLYLKSRREARQRDRLAAQEITHAG